MRRSTSLAVGSLVSAASLIAFAGCGTGITPTDTIAQAAAKVPLLNQLTVADVVQAFQDFINNAQQGQQAAANLTPDQVTQLQDLQSQLDSGALTPQDFQSKVQGVIGDAAPALAFGGFGFFGAPFGHRMGQDIATALSLTDDQKTQAQQIFQSAHDDITKLRQAAHDKILAVLTSDQQATLTQIQQQGFLSFGLFGVQPAGTDATTTTNTTAQRPRGGPRQRILQRLADALNLTTDQLNQIETIRTDLQTQVQARHQQARDAFIAILTDAQKATLTQIEARRHVGGLGLLLQPGTTSGQ